MGEATLAQGQIWERSTELRVFRRQISPSEFTEPQLQQAWVCRQTGDTRWEPVPTETEFFPR